MSAHVHLCNFFWEGEGYLSNTRELDLDASAPPCYVVIRHVFVGALRTCFDGLPVPFHAAQMLSSFVERSVLVMKY